MPFVLRCIVCDRLAELPCWRRAVAGQTSSGEVFTVDVPLCLECQERTTVEEDKADPVRG